MTVSLSVQASAPSPARWSTGAAIKIKYQDQLKYQELDQSHAIFCINASELYIFIKSKILRAVP